VCPTHRHLLRYGLILSTAVLFRLTTNSSQYLANCSAMIEDDVDVKASGRRVISATDPNVTYAADPNAQLVPQDSSPAGTPLRHAEDSAKVPGRLSIRKKPSSSEFSRQVLANRVYSSQRQHQADRVDARAVAVATSEPIGTVTHSLLLKGTLTNTK
jgi:hypothetical protein